MIELVPKEKFKHLAKIGSNVLQRILCGDCREQTDYTWIKILLHDLPHRFES